MEKRSTRVILSLLLLICFTLAACGGNNIQSSQNTTQAAQDSQTTGSGGDGGSGDSGGSGSGSGDSGGSVGDSSSGDSGGSGSGSGDSSGSGSGSGNNAVQTTAGSNDNIDQSSGNNILRLRTDYDIQNLDPAFIVRWVDDTVDRAVMEGLIRYIPNSTETMNVLAEWMEVSEDGLEISFKLKEGIMWQRGYGELTTEDVKFSFERFQDPELGAAYADDWAALDHIEIIDKYQGKIVLSEPQVTLWTTTMPLTSGLIACKQFYEDVGPEGFSTDAVGTGPYLFEEWRPTERMVLKRNPDYWGEQPDWDEIHLIPIIDDTSAEVAFEAGELDFSLITLGSTDLFESNPRYNVMTIPTLSYGWVGLNMQNPKLQDINVRQAIRYAIDVPSILEAAYFGKAEQARALLPPRVLGYWEDAPLYQRDVEKARGYMAQAGLTSLDLEIIIESTVEYRTWAEIIQQNLAEIGINLTITPLDPSAFWVAGEGDKGLELEMFAIMFSAMADPAWFTMWFTSDQVGVWNWMRWPSAEFDELHRRGLSTTDPTERASIYIEMQKLWDEAAHTVWITHMPKTYAFMPNVSPVMDSNGTIPMVRDFKVIN
ncbi:MAG: ABC transporter substrate-binding protein [Oscillospiraceae bacterium]|nr:ABC transporter substrate-binding protein [Oscillospiraceae bacterium]